jgi:hypothetical protein
VTWAQEAQACATPRSSACDLPSSLPAFLQASAQLAGGAAERGDLAAARRLLEEALRAVENAGVRPGLRVVGDPLRRTVPAAGR